MATQRTRMRWIGRAAALTAALATGLAVTITPAMAADTAHARLSWSGVWDWLTRGRPVLRLPVQQAGTARDLPHYVPASATRGFRGRGHPASRGHGQLPPFRLHAPARRTTTTRPFTGNGAHSFNPRTSKPVMSKATATSTLYRNADGSYTRLVYPGPVNYRTAGGAWHSVDIRLVRGSGGRLRETANAMSISLGLKASDLALVSVGFTPSEQVSYGLAGAAPVTAADTASTATYRSVLPYTDLRLSTVYSGLTESLILRSPRAANSWVFPLELAGLTAKLAKNGGIELISAAGKVVSVIAPAFMQDSSFQKRSGNHAMSTAVTYRLVTIHGQPAIVMTASKAWLDDPARVYPVTVDPDFNTSGTTKVLSDAGSTDYSAWDDLDVGTWDNGGEIGRSFIAFSGLGSSLAGERITAASLHIWDYWASTCTAEPFYVAPITQSWSVTGAKSYPGPSMGSSIGSVTDTPSSAQCITNTSGNTNVGGDMPVTLSTGTFNSWTTGGADNGLGIYAGTTTDLTWKRFDSYHTSHPPYLALSYTPDVAPQINSQYPPDNYNSPTLTPELIASGSDADNWPSPVKYVFTVYTTTGTQVATSGLISSGDWVVPGGKLSWAQTYYWTVQDYDGFDYSSAVNAKYFTTQVPQPLITSTLAQNSDGHGFDQSVGNYTTSATDANVQTAGPSLSVVRDYNSLDPRVSGAFGAGWSTLYDMKATEVDNATGGITSVVITYPDGSEVGFGDNNGTFSSPSGRFSTLTALPSHGGYTLTDKGDTTYTFTQAGPAGNVFDISSITDYQGDKETFTYTAGQLTTVTSAASGRALHFSWATPSGAQYPHVAAVSTDPATSGQPATALTWTYNYAGDTLTSVCPPATPTQCTGYSYTTGSHFPTAVLDAGPSVYWRLNEGSGGTAVDSVLANEGVYNGAYSNVALGQPGPLPGSAATSGAFNGTSSYMQLPASLASNASYLAGSYLTVSMWFKTTTDSEPLFAWSNSAISAGTTTGNYVPALYVGSDGKLQGEFWGGPGPIASASSVADGNWHNVVLTSAGNTLSLYLDGVPVGNPQSGQFGLTGQPNVYVGAGFLGGSWPDEAHHEQSGNTGYASYFNGDISDVALFSQYLTAPTVAALYATGHSSVGLLNKVTTPAGKTQAQIGYNSVTDRVTSVTDAKGGAWTLGAPTVAGSSAVYRSAVLGADPAGYWRLGNSGTPAQATDQVLGGPANYSSVTLGVTGPFSDQTAASFNGTSSYLQLPSSDAPGTGPASVGLWFKVPSGNTAGGVLYDYETYPLNQPGMPTGQWDPALYVGTDGKLRGEFWNGGTSAITSSSAVNDGNWHYAVLAAAASGQSLYLDGKLVGSSSTALAPSAGNYVYVGAGESANSWPDHPTNTLGYFTGSIGEVAFYKSQLSQAQVLSQWLAARSSNGLAPTETITVTDPGGQTLTYTYDPLEGNRLIAQSDGLGNRTTYGYDTSGFLYTTTQPNGNVITTGHDVRGNMVSQTTCQNQAANACSTEYYTYYPDDTSTHLSADPRDDLVLTLRDGRSASATDNRYLTTYAYNSAGNQTSATTPPVPGYPGGRTTTMTYTTSATAAVGGGTTPAGLLATTTTPGGAVETVGYYADGDVASVTDPAGEVTSYGYDAIGRVTSKTVQPEGLRTTYTYNGAGQVLTETDPAVTDHVTGDTHTPVTTNAYDADGNLTSVTVSDASGGDASRTTTYTFNAHNEMASKTDALGNTTTFAYDGYGNQVTQTDANGTTTDYAYDADGHLLTVTLMGYTGDPANPSSPVNLVEQSRAYDPDGRLASITDSMGRKTAYTYTDNGLVATVTRSNPATGQSFAVQSNTYDPAGNLTQRVTNNGTTTTNYTVDAADRTTASTLDPSGLDRTTSYAFNPDDFVVNTTISSGSTVYSSVDKTYDALGRTTSSTVHDDTTGHPAGWWPLTDGTNANTNDSPTFAVDASGGGNTAFTSPGLTWASGAAVFNGTSASISTASPALSTASSFSVSAWVNLAASSTSYIDAVSQDGVNASGFELLYAGPNNEWSFARAQSDVANRTTSQVNSTGPAATGTWTHLVGVYDSAAGSLTLYVNGVSQGSTPAGSAPWSATGPTVIGRGLYNGSPVNFFNGSICDVQVYQRALSATDVSTLYSGGRAGGALGAKPLTTKWALDQRGLPTSTTDPNGNVTSYLYDEAGKLAQVTAPAISTEVDGGAPVLAHPVTTYGYDTFGEQVSTEDPNGNVTTANYDADGRPVSTVLSPYTPPGTSTPVTAISTRTYDKIGEVTSSTDPLGNTTSSVYDQLGDVATVTQPGGGVTHYTYDTNGEQLSATNPLGAQSQATYDFMGRTLTSTQIVRQPASAADTTTSAYTDQAGYLSAVTSPTGVVTSYAYDAAGETTSTTDGAGNTTKYAYDALGRPTVTTMPDGTSQHTSYDEASNPVGSASEDAAGTVLRQTSAAFDADGHMTAATDAMGNTSTISYNAAGLPVQETQPVTSTSAIATSFGYDAVGNLTRYTNGNGNNTIYTYNSWNLPESTIVPATAADPSDRTFTTAYDADGRAVAQTSPGGVTVTSTYNALGNITSQDGTGADAPTTTRTFGYDAAGNMTSASAPGGTDTFTYDDRGLLLSASGPSGTSSFGYNAAGQTTSATTAAGTSAYTYDNAGRAATLTDPGTGATLAYAYNADSLLTSISYGSGGATQTFGYNSLHELTSDTLAAPGGATEASISYGYNANGDETSKTATGVAGASSNTYAYDEADRLTSWNNGVTTVNYGYDGDGNRTQAGSQTFTYDARDELLSGGGSTYTYSPRGTLASVTSAGGTANSTFDAFNQLINQGTQQYTYDALGRVLTGQGATFAYSGLGNNVASDGTFTYSRDPAGGLIGMANQSGAAVLALTDQHHDVVGQFTATGTALTGSTTYDPLGNVVASAGQIGNLGYQSGWTDPVTSNVNMGSRWYNPATGQFLSRDSASNNPIPDSANANTFAYGNDNPLTAYDPTGTCDWWNPFCGAAQVVSNVAQAASNAWNTVTTAASNAWNNFTNDFHGMMAQAWNGLTRLATSAVHTLSTVVHKVQDGWNTTWHAVTQTWNNAVHTVQKVVTATYHAVKYAVHTAVQFVQHHAAAIVSFVASTAVFLGCEAAVSAITAGAASLPGAVGCSALAGAVGNAVTYAMTTPVSKWSLGGFASTALEGAAVGAAGGLLGPLGSKLLGPVVDAVASRLGPALVDDAADALANDVTDSALDSASSDVGTAADSSASDASAAASDAGPADPATTEPSGDPASSEPATSEPTSSEPTSSEPTSSEPATSEGDPAMSCSLNSFTGNTKVLLANGKRVAIDKLRAGQRVRAGDPRTGANGPRKITRVIRHSGVHAMVAITLAGGVVIRATAHHLLWDATADRFAYASAVKPGHSLAEPGGHLIRVAGTRAYQANLTAYNLSISGIHTYYVVAGPAAVLVHNSCPKGSLTGAFTRQARAAYLQSQRTGIMGNQGTTAVIRLWNSSTGDIMDAIATESRNMPNEWQGLLKTGENFIPGAGHAEQTILNWAADNGWEPIEGGASRNVCIKICSQMLRRLGLTLGGPTFAHAAQNTAFRMFWRF